MSALEQQLARLSDALAASADAACSLQAADGSMPSGHNGPHNDLETPVRATANWLQVFTWAWEQRGDDRMKRGAERCIEYLFDPAHRPGAAVFLCRLKTSGGRLASNGPIGQAWVIDALAAAANVFGRDDCARLAADVFLAHPFDDRAGLWHGVEIDGSSRGIHKTLNQQIWFAAAGSRLPESMRTGVIDARIRRFASRLDRYVDLHTDGVIMHILASSWTGKVRRSLRRALRRTRVHWQDRGYHAFLLAGVARLEESGYLRLEGGKASRLRRAMRPLLDPAWRASLDEDPFSGTYNPTGFEAAFVLLVFRELLRGVDVDSVAASWIADQLDRHFDPGTGLMNLATDDPNNLASRIAEGIAPVDTWCRADSYR